MLAACVELSDRQINRQKNRQQQKTHTHSLRYVGLPFAWNASDRTDKRTDTQTGRQINRRPSLDPAPDGYDPSLQAHVAPTAEGSLFALHFKNIPQKASVIQQTSSAKKNRFSYRGYSKIHISAMYFKFKCATFFPLI